MNNRECDCERPQTTTVRGTKTFGWEMFKARRGVDLGEIGGLLDLMVEECC